MPGRQAYTGVVGLKQGDLDAFILEITLGLGQVQGGVVRRGVPKPALIMDRVTNRKPFCNNVNSYQFVRKVILSVDILRDQSVSYKESAANSGVPVLALGGGRLRSMSFRWYYPDQVRPVFLRTNSLLWYPLPCSKTRKRRPQQCCRTPGCFIN
jgi:hypothetical protein